MDEQAPNPFAPPVYIPWKTVSLAFGFTKTPKAYRRTKKNFKRSERKIKLERIQNNVKMRQV